MDNPETKVALGIKYIVKYLGEPTCRYPLRQLVVSNTKPYNLNKTNFQIE